MPEINLDLSPPEPVRRAPVLPGTTVSWTLKADYPAPYGMAWIRYCESQSDEYLEILTGSGALLQRITLDPSLDTKPPKVAQALYLKPIQKQGPLLYFADDNWHHFFTFPDGFAGFLSASSAPKEDKSTARFEREPRGTVLVRVAKDRYFWSGVSFVQAKQPSDAVPDIIEATPPRNLQLSPTKDKTRFAAVFFDRFHFIRWVPQGKTFLLEVLDKTGRRIAHHPLRDDFGTSPHFSTLTATWLDEKRQRSPVIVVRDSDQVRVHVFRDGLVALIATQDFSDFSTSISATTTTLGRDKHGLLTVSETYSERGDEDGNGGTNSETNYHWNGKKFVTQR